MPDMMSHLGPRLRQARERRGLSQKEVAELTGAFISNLCCYEKGKRTPSLTLFVAIARVLGVSTDYLLGIFEESSAKEEIREMVNNFQQLLPQDRQLIAAIIRRILLPSREECPTEIGVEDKGRDIDRAPQGND